MSYDFSKLTNAQKTLLSFAGWHVGSVNPQPDKRTVAKLITRGLVVATTARERAGPFFMSFVTYDVPISVHIAWCERCSAKAA
jgi:hypothetical protein